MNAQRAAAAPNANNTVIGSVPLRIINDSSSFAGGAAKYGSSPPNAQLGPQAPTSGESFKVSVVISVLFAKLPANLKDHIAFRHFYTDELDPGAHALCIKYFTLFVLYFCTVFRLEGRRRHYLEQPTERSGREFAAAHKRASTVFHELSAAYSAILMRYNRHSEITYTARHAILVKGRTSGKSLTGAFHNMNQMLEVKEPAFKFESEDFLFYEHLSAFALQIVRLAFAEDPNMQEKALSQVTEMFRSRSFTFNPQRRRMEVKALEKQLDTDSLSIKENTLQIAELLTSQDPKIIVKYANQQRTPFVQTRFPGGTSFMKYQRPKQSGFVKPEPSKIEKQYTIESEHANFPLDHPAMYRIRLWQLQKREYDRAAAEFRRMNTGLTPEPILGGSSGRNSSFSTSNMPTNRGHSPSMVSSSSNVGGGGGFARRRFSSGAVNNNPTLTSRHNSSMFGMSTTMPATPGRVVAAAGGSSAFRTHTPLGNNGPSSRSQTPLGVSTSGGLGGGLSISHRGGVGISLSHNPMLGQPIGSGGGVGSLPTTARNHLPPLRNPTAAAAASDHNVSMSAAGVGAMPTSPHESYEDTLGATLTSRLNATTNGGGGGGATTSSLNNTMGATNGGAFVGSNTINLQNGGGSPFASTQQRNLKSENDHRLELEEREGKFYEIFALPRMFSTHAASTGTGMSGHNPAAICGAAAVHYAAVAAAANANSSRAPPPPPFQLIEPTAPLTIADFKAALATVTEAWANYDLTQEIDAVYQAVANGVVVKDLSLPSDIMLCYDDVGVLYVDEKEGTPMKAA